MSIDFTSKSDNEKIRHAIKNKLLVKLKYDGEDVIIAPLTFGIIKVDKTILAAFVEGYSESIELGTSDSDFRTYNFKKIARMEILDSGFTIGLSSNYLTKRFKTVYEVVR